MLARLAHAMILATVLALPASGQGTGIVPSGDLVYADIDRLSELGVLDSVIMGQRPFSRREIARIARGARERMDGGRRGASKHFGEDVVAYVENVLARLERFTREGAGDGRDGEAALIDGGSLAVGSTDASRRGWKGALTRELESTIDPLAERRVGKVAPAGEFAALELSHRFEYSDWLAVQARERVELRSPDDGSLSGTSGEVLLAFARVRARNVALTVGRQQTTWAQSPGDGLFLASDAPALDQVSLSGDHPFALPGLLRRLGPMQATLVVANLGPSRVRSGSRLLTYKVSVQPMRSMEIGGTFLNHFGGEGARRTSATNRIIDFLPFIDVFRKHDYTTTDPDKREVDSDKVIGADARWRVSALGGTLFTGEILIDDFDTRRLPKLLTGYGSQTFSMVIPGLGSTAVSARLSAKHMGIITSTHGDLSNGLTTRGRLLGDELGPDAKSYSAQLRWDPSAGLHVELDARSSIYSLADYRAFYRDAAQTDYAVEKVSSRPDELRERLLGTVVAQSVDGLALTLRAGVERTRNANFAGGRRRDYVAQIALRMGH